MTNSVFHIGLGIVLNLTEPDLGVPEIPDLWEQLQRDRRLPVAERQLQCPQCRETRPSCPEMMYVTERGGTRFASHFNSNIKDHPDSRESDQHKAFKDRIAKAAELGGFGVDMESRAVDGKRVTDVLVRGDERLIGWEVQLSYASDTTVRRRAGIARRDGITPLWSTVDKNAQWINHVPWARTDDMPWQMISTGRDLLVRGGVRELRLESCDYRNPLPCPVKGQGRCGKRHGTWDLALDVQLDDLARWSASGDYVPVIVPIGKKHNRWWVRATDRDIYAESLGVLPSEDDVKARRTASIADPQVKPLDLECLYGVDSGFRASPAELRDPDGAVSVTLPGEALPPSPVRRPQRPGFCSVGEVQPCDAPARLYPAGWRCGAHAPGRTSAGGQR